MTDPAIAATPATFRECHVINTAFVHAPERVILRGGTGRRMQLPVTVGLLRHPTAGWGLFDAGSSPHIDDAARRWPFSMYPRVVRSFPSESGPVIDALPTLGLTAADIRWIVVSHFHPDHVGGLADFPAARLITTKEGYDYARSLNGWRALRRAVLPDLLPGDFAARATLVGNFSGAPLGALGATHDVFGDGSAQLVRLPGHARGQVGMLARLPAKTVLLSADGCYLSRAIRENRPPHWITALFADDMHAVRRTIAALHAFAAGNPDVDIVPTHCPEAFDRWNHR